VRATELAEEEAATRLATKTDLVALQGHIDKSVSDAKLTMALWAIGTGMVAVGLTLTGVYFILAQFAAHLKP
jgi:hypothetical protein